MYLNTSNLKPQLDSLLDSTPIILMFLDRCPTVARVSILLLADVFTDVFTDVLTDPLTGSF